MSSFEKQNDIQKHDEFYRAMLARDYRFDGKFFVGVKTTGIYCRPICPARPLRKNVEFFSLAAHAEKKGYRPCLRCRPEAAPHSPAWYGKSALVQRALKKLIDVGLSEEGEDQFAAHFGVSARHLRRLFLSEIGRTPQQFYQEQRLNLARKMLVETQISITDIALSSGFQSLRRFNDAFKERFSKTPSEVRKTNKARAGASIGATLRLSYRPPFNWVSILKYLKHHELIGIETIDEDSYARFFKTQNGVSRLVVKDDPTNSALLVDFEEFDRDSLYINLQNLRRLFDLDADPLLISTQYEKSPVLRKADQNRPGGRAPGAWNPFEVMINIILGQLVSNQMAKKLTAQLIENYGEAFDYKGRVVKLFPTPAVLATSDLSELKTTGKRKECIREISRKVLNKEISLSPHQDVQKFKEQLIEISGFGPWTVEYVSMRCLGDADSFPASDLILKRVQDKYPKTNLDQIKPWRTYAYLLWEEYSNELSKKKASRK